MAVRRKPKPTRRKTAGRPRRASAPPRASAPRRASKSRRASARKPSAGLGLKVHHLDYTTHDLQAVRRFYDLLGFTSSYDPKHEYLTVQVTGASTIGFMPPAPGPPEQWRPPREPALYLVVADVDAAHARLAARGIPFGQPPRDMPWGHRAAWLRDPEGRMVWIATRGAK